MVRLLRQPSFLERMIVIMPIIHMKDEAIDQEIAASPIPVLVDFWAEWCGPCRMLSPIVKELEEQYRGKIKVCTVDIDKQPTHALLHRVLSIPTICLYKNGQEVKRLIGLRDKPELDQAIRALLEA